MPSPTAHRLLCLAALRRSTAVVGAALLVALTASTASGADAGIGSVPAAPIGVRTVTYHGYQVGVPSRWKVVDLTTRPHACVRFDHPAVYLGHPGDQRDCPSHLIGGAPGLLVEPLDASSAAGLTTATVSATSRGDVEKVLLPQRGPVTVAVHSAGVVVTAVYGDGSARLAQRVLAGGRVLATAHPSASRPLPEAPTARVAGASVPGDYVGRGFDACTAPSQASMDAWRTSSAYRSIGVYIGGVSRGCAQPNLTATWVAQQVRSGWHLIATYVGRQAPCAGFVNRISYDPHTARVQGRADAGDAAAQAAALGLAAPSTLYSDIEGYDNTNAACVDSVLSYAAGWTRGLHSHGYTAGVYSSAASGMRDLSAAYSSRRYDRPDDIWLAWWNDVPDVDGGGYVPDSQWSNHQRIHQYAGNVAATYGGYTIQIDRDYLDVSSAVQRPQGCPTKLNFAAYPVLRRGDRGAEVVAAQCQLARRGFDPGAATGTVRWRTAAAIRAFNASRGLRARAVVGRRTWTALLSGGATRVLAQGSTGRVVSKLQRALSASLERTVAIRHRFDRRTRRAVLDYQRAHGLVADGTAGRTTWRALQSGD